MSAVPVQFCKYTLETQHQKFTDQNFIAVESGQELPGGAL